MEERERGDLDPRHGQGDASGGTMPEREEGRGDGNGDEAREVLRLGERLEDPGRRVDAQVVEDGEVEGQERKQCARQAEQQPGGRARGPVDGGGGEGGHAEEHNFVIVRCQGLRCRPCPPPRPRARPCSTPRWAFWSSAVPVRFASATSPPPPASRRWASTRTSGRSRGCW